MPTPSEALNKPKANAYAQKVVVKQAARTHAADQSPDSQKQRLLQPDSPKGSDSPRSPAAPRPQQLPPLSNYSPRQLPQQQPEQQQQQLPQQSPPQLPQQVETDQWQWPGQQTAAPAYQQQAFDLTAEQPALNQQPNAQARVRPQSAPVAESLVQTTPSYQSQDQSQASEVSSRSRTTTASPRPTNEQPFGTIRVKNVSWQDAEGEDLCHYREFEPSDAGDSDSQDTDWQAQKKGCCILM